MSESTAHPLSKAFLAAEQKKYFTFVNLAFLMTALTGVELILIFLPLPPIVIGTVLVSLSLIKFVGVIFWFMHLVYDKVFLTFVFLFGMALATATIAALLALFGADRVDTSLPFYEAGTVSVGSGGH